MEIKTKGAEMTRKERIESIYTDLKLADRMTPGRTPWQTLRKRAEDIAGHEENADYLSESVVYGGEIMSRGAMIADLQRIAADESDNPAEQQAFVSRYLQGFDRGVAARASFISAENRNLSQAW